MSKNEIALCALVPGNVNCSYKTHRTYKSIDFEAHLQSPKYSRCRKAFIRGVFL